MSNPAVADLRVLSADGTYIGPPIIISPTFLSLLGTTTAAATFAKGSNIASAATTNLAQANGRFVDITGTTTITSFGNASYQIGRLVRFTGILTLTHNATSLILPTGAPIVTAAGDIAEFWNIGSSNWICVRYLRADGTPLTGGSILAASITTTQNNYNPTGFNPFTNAIVFTCASGTPTLTGLTGGTADRLLLLFNSKSSAVSLQIGDENGGSTATNRFSGINALGVNSIEPGVGLLLRYNGTSQRWTVENSLILNVSGIYGRSTITPGAFVFTNDGGTPILYYNWEDGLNLLASFTVGTYFSVDGGGIVQAPLVYPIESPAQFTGNKDNYASAKAQMNRLSSDASRNITGFTAPVHGGTACLFDINIGSFDIVYKHQVTSVAGNRILCSTGADITLSAGQMLIRMYDPVTARWRVSKLP